MIKRTNLLNVLDEGLKITYRSKTKSFSKKASMASNWMSNNDGEMIRWEETVEGEVENLRQK